MANRYVFRIRYEDGGDDFALPLGVPLRAALNTAQNYSQRRRATVYLDRARSMGRGLSRGEYSKIAEYDCGKRVGGAKRSRKRR